MIYKVYRGKVDLPRKWWEPVLGFFAVMLVLVYMITIEVSKHLYEKVIKAYKEYKETKGTKGTKK